jgi:surface protein
METYNNINFDSKNIFSNIKSKYILKKIFNNLEPNKFFKIIKHNKNLHNRLEITENDYKDFLNIEIEIYINKKPKKNNPLFQHHYYQNYNFINFDNIKKYNCFYHLYINDDIKESIKKFGTKGDDVKKIRIIIDYNEKFRTFQNLFKDCFLVEKINFIKFNRTDITDMSYMFDGCFSLEEINLTNFKTKNVTKMNCMFYLCNSLEKINISHFNIKNVKDMSWMFTGCYSLEEIILPKLNNCINMSHMFSGCKNELIKKIKKKYKYIKNDAF